MIFYMSFLHEICTCGGEKSYLTAAPLRDPLIAPELAFFSLSGCGQWFSSFFLFFSSFFLPFSYSLQKLMLFCSSHLEEQQIQKRTNVCSACVVASSCACCSMIPALAVTVVLRRA